MFVIALRFIPTLQIEGKRIQEAQLARGYNPGSGVGGKIQRLIPIMVPLVSNALSRANVLGLTIDIRGYRTRETYDHARTRACRAGLCRSVTHGYRFHRVCCCAFYAYRLKGS